jgi:hypothetical protein
MKVEDPRHNLAAAVSAARFERSRPVETPSGSSHGDHVELSSDLALADAAIRAAGSGDVRPEAVARGRALLDSGGLGADLDALAGHILTALTDVHDFQAA